MVEETVVIADSTTVPATEQVDNTSKVEDGSDRSIPYSRFKEKVSEVKDLKKQIEKIAAEKDSLLADTARQYQTYYESEIAKIKRGIEQAQTTDYSQYTQPTQVRDDRVEGISSEINNLKGHIEKMKQEAEEYKLQTKVGSLKSVYPSMDEEHVYAVKKLKPDWSLEDCAEYSHKHFEDAVKSRYDKLVESKKAAAKRPVFGEGGKLNIKPEERPKNFADARKKMMQYAEMME